MQTNYKPKDWQHLITYLVVRDVENTIHFLEQVFEAEALEKAKDNGVVIHAEVKLKDTILMIGKAQTEDKIFPAMLYVYVPSVDDTYKKALSAGTTSVQEPQDTHYKDRNACVQDSDGNQWWIGTHFGTLGH